MSDSLAGILPGTTTNADPWAAGVAGSTGTALGTGTGAHGLVPVTGLLGGGVGTAINEVWQFLNAPFTTPLDPTSLFLIVGTILVAIIAWNLILYHIRIAAETI
jgi:hypothetical protein